MRRGWTAKLQGNMPDGKLRPIHGLRNTPEGSVWIAMIGRCYNETHAEYRRYGARGINVCQFLKETPHNLISSIGKRPSGLSLDRINNDLGYYCGQCQECLLNKWPKNIRWADKWQQAENRRTSILIESGGEIRCASSWARKFGFEKSLIAQRFRKGFSKDRLFSIPVKRYEINGQSKTLLEWSKISGIKIKTLRKRLEDKVPVEQLLKPLNHAYRRTDYRKARV